MVILFFFFSYKWIGQPFKEGIFVELLKKNIHMEHHLNLATTQISLEEDQNISDQKPDAFQIICKKACVKTEEVRPQEDAVHIKGTLLYQVLYLTDEKEKRLCNLEGEIPFEEKLYTSQNIANENIRVTTRVEDLMIRLINSRKLNIRCIIAVSVTQDELYDEEVVVDVDEPNSCEILKKPLDITTIVLDTRDIYRIKEEIPLPDGMPNIYNVLWKNVRVDGLNFIPMEGRIGVQGEWTAFFLYEGEEEENLPKYFEVVRPFSGIIEVPDCQENMILCVECENDPPQIEVRSDYDGEERLIGMDMELKLYIKLYQNTVMSIVADAYGLNEPLEPIMKDSTCEHMLKKEIGKIKLNDTWENRENPQENLQILHVDGTIVDERIQPKEEEVQLSGVVHMELLCSTDDETAPYRCISIDMPYQQMINIMGAKEDCPYFGKVCIEQLMANVQGERIEVRALLSYQINVYQKIMKPLLAGMGKIMENNNETSLPVMSVYFAKDKEAIWEVGKKYRVSLNGIRTVNQLNADELADGQKILIVKEMR